MGKGKNGKRVATERVQWPSGCVCMSLHRLLKKKELEKKRGAAAPKVEKLEQRQQ